MKPWLIAALIVSVAATAVPGSADAKRIAGGKSSGLQRNMPARTAPDAPPAKPAAPAQNAQPAQGQQAAAPAATPAAANAAATPPRRSWMGPIAGLAAGLGLAALASHFGFGEALANGLMLALLVGGALLLITFLVRRFGAARNPALAGAGAGSAGSVPLRSEPPLRRRAEPEFAAAAPASSASGAAPTEPAVTRAFVPAAFDSEGFARTAKMIFIRLQAAHDSADLDDLKRFTTPEMFASLRLDIQERGNAAQHTDVVDVASEVLDVAQEPERQIVSVRFHGHLVEERGAAPVAFDEVWHLVRPHDESRPWVIAGIEQMA